MKPYKVVAASMATVLLILALATGCSGDDGDAPAGAAATEGGAGPESSAGPEATLGQQFDLSIVFTSPVFNQKRRIPKKHTCTKISGNDPNISPPLAWESIPVGAKSIALIMDSQELVGDAQRVHWVIWNIPPEVPELSEEVPHKESLDSGASQGTNDDGAIGYLGPCPPVIVIGQEGDISAGVFKKQEIEKYTFRIYALDARLELAPGATKSELLRAIEGHVLAGGVLVGERQGPTAFEKTKF